MIAASLPTGHPDAVFDTSGSGVALEPIEQYVRTGYPDYQYYTRMRSARLFEPNSKGTAANTANTDTPFVEMDYSGRSIAFAARKMSC